MVFAQDRADGAWEEPRATALLVLADGTVLEGTGLGADGAAVGRVTAASRHHELGPIALAVLKRSVDPGVTLAVATSDGPELAAAQQVIVPPDAGAEANVPRLPRVGAVRR